MVNPQKDLWSHYKKIFSLLWKEFVVNYPHKFVANYKRFIVPHKRCAFLYKKFTVNPQKFCVPLSNIYSPLLLSIPFVVFFSLGLFFRVFMA
jgi:hypothetical protein